MADQMYYNIIYYVVASSLHIKGRDNTNELLYTLKTYYKIFWPNTQWIDQVEEVLPYIIYKCY